MTEEKPSHQSANYQTNVVSEIDESSGVHVPLGKVEFGEQNESSALFSNKWSASINKLESVDDYNYSFTSNGASKNATKQFNDDGEINDDQVPIARELQEHFTETNRARIEQAVKGEEKKSVNPRLIKAGLGVLGAIVITGFIFLSMTGEKKKSFFSKNKNGNVSASAVNESETARNESAETGSGETDRRKGSLKFGEVQVGSDPNSSVSSRTTSGESQPALNTEEAKKMEMSDPYAYPSPNPVYSSQPNPGYPNGDGYSNPGGYGLTAAKTNSNIPINQTEVKSSDQVTAKNQPKNSNNNAVDETGLKLETDEDRFKVVLRAGQNNGREESQNIDQASSESNVGTESKESPKSILPRGTRLELNLDEPIRSGIGTAVTSKVKKGIADKTGEIIIPKDSMVVIQFSAQVANGRVFNEKKAPIQIVTPDGRSFEFYGMVKDAQGFAGLTGKVTKVGGKGTLSRVGGVFGRVGGMLPGGRIVTGAEREIDGLGSGNQDYVTGAQQIVEIPRGTAFTVIIGY